MIGTVPASSGGSKTRLVVVMILVLAAAAAAGLASAHSGILGKARGAYDRWSLRSRVDSLWESRLQGDLARTGRFVISDGKPKVGLGQAVQYLAYEVQDMTIEGEKAEVRLAIKYRVAMGGFKTESAPADTMVMRQSWVRSGRVWYWDPGPPPPSSHPVRRVPKGSAAGTAAPTSMPPQAAPAEQLPEPAPKR